MRCGAPAQRCGTSEPVGGVLPARGSFANSFRRLYSVFRLIPSAAAVRSLLCPQCSNVARINWRSACAIDVPTWTVMVWPLAGADAGSLLLTVGCGAAGPEVGSHSSVMV